MYVFFFENKFKIKKEKKRNFTFINIVYLYAFK